MSESQSTEFNDEDVVVLPEGQQEEQAKREEPKRKPRFSGVEDEDAEYGVKVQKRLAVYSRQRNEARAELDRERQARIAAERALAEHFKTSLASSDESLEREFKAAQMRQQRAFQEGNGEEVSAASAELARIAAQQSEVRRQAQGVRIPEEHRPQPQVSSRTQEYIDANPWFETDPEARELAIVSDRQAKQRGLQADTPEYFDFVTKRVKAVFPQHFEDGDQDVTVEGEQPRRAPPAPVAPARRTVPGTPAQKAKLPSLTADEADMARRMGLTPLQYAKGKMAVKQREV